MSVGVSNLVFHLKLPQCNISCQESMSIGVSHLVIHLKLPQCNISCQKSMSVGVSHLVIHLKLYNTSAKIIHLNEWGCRDGMHYAKNHGNKEMPLAILSRLLAQSCVTVCLNYVGRGYA